MYESPIQIIARKITEEINEEDDRIVLNAVWQKLVAVDKNELCKALQYDRDQYDNGFRDGLEAAVIHAHWNHGDEICRDFIGDVLVSTTYDLWKCSNCEYKVENCNVPLYSYCPHCGAKMDDEEKNDV